MSDSPPQGSKIEIGFFDGYEHITLPHGHAGVLRFFIGAFLLFWLGGWFMGFTSAAKEVMSGEGGAFSIFWLCGWTVGGEKNGAASELPVEAVEEVLRG